MFCFAFAIVGCESEKPYFLTRSSAQLAIRNWPEFESKTWAEFATGRQRNFAETGATFLLMQTVVPGSSNATFLNNDRMNDGTRCVATAEELENERKNVYLFLGCFHTWPSKEGQVLIDSFEGRHLLLEYPASKNLALNLQVVHYSVKIGDPTVLVTGIVEEGNHATVDFDLGFTNLNEFGKAMFPINADYLLKYSQKAEFTKYDDGWRITKMGNQLWGYGSQ